MQKKLLDGKSYGSIPHLPGSRKGQDGELPIRQAEIAIKKVRDKYDKVWVTEKLDGSNVGVLKKDNRIYAINRAGYNCNQSPHLVHRLFDNFVNRNYSRFDSLINEGDRLCGEYLEIAHGTKYILSHEPFVVFDYFEGKDRLGYFDFLNKIDFKLVTPYLLNEGEPISITTALSRLKPEVHGALEEIEGCIWRVERNGKLDFLSKYVRPTKIDGKYFKDENGKDIVIYNDFIGKES